MRRHGAPLGLALLLAATPVLAQTQLAAPLNPNAPQALLSPGFAPLPCPCEGDLIAEVGFAAGQVGYVLFDPVKGTVVASHNLDQGFIPASVEKIPTLLAGLAVLGPEHRFETAVVASRKPRGGVLDGDLFLKGGGDPFLTTDDVLNFVLALKDQGLTSVEGGFFFDEAALPRIREINPRQPVAVAYNPGLSALNVNFNIVELTWYRAPETGILTGTALSKSDTLDVAAEAVTFAPLEQAVSKTIPWLFDRDATVDRWLLSPALPKEGEARLPVKQPGLNAATIFKRLAADQGLALADPLPAMAPEDGAVLKLHQSVSLDRAAQLILRYSNNLSAELVGLATSRRLGAAPSDLATSGAELARWLREQMPAVDWSGFVAANHSGLSADSRMTPRQIMAILQYAQGLTADGIDLYALLAPVKWSGELMEGRDEEATDLVVRAKSGTIHFSRALAGYMLTEGGRRLGFAVFVGDLDQRRAYDQAINVDELVEVPGARAWMKRAKALEQALVTRWVTGY